MIVRVPASSANLGPGFDALGMALALHLELTTEPDTVPGSRTVDQHHPAMVAFRREGGTGPLAVRSPIPAARGLGFSGAARVAGVTAAHVQRGDDPLDRDAIVAAAAELEGHADNVAASVHGGIVAVAGGRVVSIPLALDPTVVVWVPGTTSTRTDESRGKVRRPIPFDDAVFSIGRTALLVAALAAGDVTALRTATEDRIHQDLRLAAAPASRHALDALLAGGAWGAWLSGSGPTVAALCPSDRAAAIAAALPDGGTAKTLRIDHTGVAVERPLA